MTANGIQPNNKRPYITAYQRAKAKAKRHSWPSARASGIVPVRHLVKSLHKKQEDMHLLQNEYANKIKKKKNLDHTIEITPKFQKGYQFRQTAKRRPPGRHLELSRKDTKSQTEYNVVYTFKFFATRSQSTYTVQAFYYEEVDTFMMKFFNSSHKSKNKYGVRTGTGDVIAILRTNFDILLHLNKQFPHANFGFIGERSFFKDKSSGNTLLEPMENNQRFRIYRLFLQQSQQKSRLIKSFECYFFNALSTSLLLNKAALDTTTSKGALSHILDFMASAYPELNYSDL